MRLGKCNRKPSPSGGRCRGYTRRMWMSAQAIWEIALTSACFGGFAPLLCRCNLSCQIFLLLQLCLLIRQAFACHLPRRGRLGRSPYRWSEMRTCPKSLANGEGASLLRKTCGGLSLRVGALPHCWSGARTVEDACPYGFVHDRIVGRGLRTVRRPVPTGWWIAALLVGDCGRAMLAPTGWWV